MLFESLYFRALRHLAKFTKYGVSKTAVKGTFMSDNINTKMPSTSYVMASWAVLAIGVVSYFIGLWNADFQLNEKGYYLTVFLLSMFSAVTLQKTVRDKEDGIPVTNVFMGLCWFSFGAGIALLTIGLFNAQILLSEKGFFGIAFLMSLFAMITVQKNIRDMTDDEGNTSPNAFPKKTELSDLVGEIVD